MSPRYLFTVSTVNCELGEREKIVRDFHHISGESNAESMILVEKGLCELASLKVDVIFLYFRLSIKLFYVLVSE